MNEPIEKPIASDEPQPEDMPESGELDENGIPFL